MNTTLKLPTVSARRKDQLLKALATTQDFRKRVVPVNPAAELAEALFMLDAEQEHAPRRSILKALHGRVCVLRQRLEWAQLERALLR